MSRSMYIVIGHYSPDKAPAEREKRGQPAELSFPTLDEAMKKLRDLVEADEIDTDGPMFLEYGIRIDPLPRAQWQKDEEEAQRGGGAERPKRRAPEFHNGSSAEAAPERNPFKFPRR